jgi:aspartyl protease family protein
LHKLLGLILVIVAVFAGFGLMLGGQLGGGDQAPRAHAIAPQAVPAAPIGAATPGPRIVALRGDSRGHFITDAQVNGRFIRVLVDTGASIVALSAEDARAAGIDPPGSAYTIRMQTANGVVMAARVRLAELRLQSIVIRDVEAAILPQGALKGTLLGMSFLNRLQGFEMQGGTLVLRQ